MLAGVLSTIELQEAFKTSAEVLSPQHYRGPTSQLTIVLKELAQNSEFPWALTQ